MTQQTLDIINTRIKEADRFVTDDILDLAEKITLADLLESKPCLAETLSLLSNITRFHTAYAPDALIWHEPRGSLGELFRNSAKYTADAVLQSPHDPAVAAYIKGYGWKNAGFLVRNTIGFFYRCARFLVGRETRQRLAQPIFWNAQALGAIWGVCKGRRRLKAKPQAANAK